jgi:DNA polymerase delta subunit 1
MVKLKLPDEDVLNMDAQFKMATWLAGEITKDFKAPNDLEMEVSFNKLVAMQEYIVIKK